MVSRHLCVVTINKANENQATFLCNGKCDSPVSGIAEGGSVAIKLLRVYGGCLGAREPKKDVG